MMLVEIFFSVFLYIKINDKGWISIKPGVIVGHFL